MSKILIIEDEKYLLELYKMKFEREGFEVVTAEDGREGIEAAIKEQPDLILLDIVMPGMDGFEVLNKLRENKKTKHLKVYIFSNLGQADEIKAGFEHGADGYMVKANLTPGQVVDRVSLALSANQKKKKKTINNKKKIVPENKEKNGKSVLIIEDEKVIIDMYKMRLENEGYEVEVADNGAWGLKLAKGKKFDIIVMDMVMPAMDGYRMLKEIKNESRNKKTPIIVLSNSAQEEDIEKAKKQGADLYLLKSSITPAKLAKRIEELIN